MSNKTPNDASLQTTKQMLDELDSLMERMLSLPVNDLDGAPPFPQEVVKAAPVSPAFLATLALLEAPPAPVRETLAETQSYVATPASWSQHPVLNPPHITPSSMKPEATEAVSPAAPQPEVLTNELMPPSLLSKLEPLLETIPEPATRMTTQWGYLPLVWINQRFDHSTVILGRGGSWLRSQAGRTMLGFTGVGLMLGAVGWFLKDWLGWN